MYKRCMVGVALGVSKAIKLCLSRRLGWDRGIIYMAAGAAAAAEAGAAAAETGGVYQTGDLILDDILKRVTLADEEVTLTALEYSILRLLMANMNRVFSSIQIYESVWDEPALQVPKTVSVHIRHIREKIEINPKEPVYLKVIYGLGYKVVKLQ